MVTATLPGSRLRLNKFRVQNYMRVELAEIDLDGQHLKVTGRNGSGKSSIIKAWMDLIRGHNKRDGAEPVHEGADRAILKADLGDIVVERTIAPDGTAKLKVSAAEGGTYKRPQEMLDSLIGPSSVDPCAFIRQKPREQVDQVLKICGVKCPEQQVYELTGERFPAKPGEPADAYLQRLGGDEVGVFYVRRREAGRVADSKRHAAMEQEEALLKLGGWLSEADKPQSASQILEEIDGLQKAQQIRQNLKTEAESLSRDLATCRVKLESLRNEEVVACAEIERIKAMLLHQESHRSQLQARIKDGEQVCSELAADAKLADSSFAQSKDWSADIASAKTTLASIETVNEGLRRRQSAQEQLQRFRREAEDSLETHRRAENILSDVRGLWSKILQGARLGIPGLSVGEGELRLHDKPFHTQASTAEQIDVATAIAMIPNSVLRVIAIDGGESLDLEMLERVIKRAGENDYQVVWSEVDRKAEALSFEIVEA
jgi:hypothetical protein